MIISSGIDFKPAYHFVVHQPKVQGEVHGTGAGQLAECRVQYDAIAWIVFIDEGFFRGDDVTAILKPQSAFRNEHGSLRIVC